MNDQALNTFGTWLSTAMNRPLFVGESSEPVITREAIADMVDQHFDVDSLQFNSVSADLFTLVQQERICNVADYEPLDSDYTDMLNMLFAWWLGLTNEQRNDSNIYVTARLG